MSGLSVKDNPINRKVIINLINNLGYKADFVSDGRELVDNFNIEHHKVVITDMVSFSARQFNTQNRICPT